MTAGVDVAASRGGGSRTAERPLRVAFCIDNMHVGGTELNAVRTASHLVAAGIELSVFSLSDEGPLLDRYARLGVPVDHLPLKKLYGLDALRFGRRMLGIIRQRGVDVVHAHDFYSNIFAAPWARLGGAAFLASRRWWEGPERRSQRWANRLSYVLANRVLANSPSVARLLIREEHLASRKVVVVPNFLDPEAFEPPAGDWKTAIVAELGLPAHRVVVGSVASLSAIKDHGTLLRAGAELLRTFPHLHVVLVGRDGGNLASLQALAKSLGMADHVHFAGVRPSLPSPHHLFDVSVLTSLSEGFPNSILEAMASGRPVVATRVGGIPDAVRENETGFLVPSRDPTQLASQIGRLLEDPSLARRLGDQGREVARREYSAGAAVTALIETYRTLAAASPS